MHNHLDGRTCAKHPAGMWLYWNDQHTRVVKCERDHEDIDTQFAGIVARLGDLK